jgi:hypothetical protein
MRFQNYPLSYYGIGSQIPDKPVAVVNANYFNVRERFVYRVKGNLFAGLELDYQQLQNAKFEPKDKGPTGPEIKLPLGAGGSQNLGGGFGLLLDSRHNMLNVRDGYLVELSFIHYGKLFDQSFPMNTLFFDSRYFIPTTKNQVLALQVVGQFSQGEVPFNQLSLMGGETIMRGYYLGRYRDKNYVAAQAEYRFLPFGFSNPNVVLPGVLAIQSPSFSGANVEVEIQPNLDKEKDYIIELETELNKIESNNLKAMKSQKKLYLKRMNEINKFIENINNNIFDAPIPQFDMQFDIFETDIINEQGIKVYNKPNLEECNKNIQFFIKV